MYKKSTPKLQEFFLSALEMSGKIIAFFVCVSLIITSACITFHAFQILYDGKYSIAIQDGLFVLILLEMFYVTRSFIRFGTINVSIVIDVGIIAAVKELIFRLNSITMQLAIAFGVLFVTLGLTYYMEMFYYEKMVKKK